MSHDNEQWFKIWRGIDLSFRNWHKEFDKFWPEHFKVSENLILMGFIWAKYTFFELKKYRRVIFHDTEEWCKIWRGINLSFENWQKEFDEFWSEHWKVSITCTLMGSLIVLKIEAKFLVNWLVLSKTTWGI